MFKLRIMVFTMASLTSDDGHADARQLEFEDVWAMFGEGRHPDIARLFEHRLAPFMTQTSIQFWRKRLHYFRTGLYYQGGMVRRMV